MDESRVFCTKKVLKLGHKRLDRWSLVRVSVIHLGVFSGDFLAVIYLTPFLPLSFYYLL